MSRYVEIYFVHVSVQLEPLRSRVHGMPRFLVAVSLYQATNIHQLHNCVPRWFKFLRLILFHMVSLDYIQPTSRVLEDSIVVS